MKPRKALDIESEIKQSLCPVACALSASEVRYRRLFETAQDGILIIDADTGDITDANPFLVDMLGYVREDFIGKAVWGFGPFKVIRANKSAFHDLMRNGYIRYEHLPLESKNGRMQSALRAILANASEAIETQGVIRITCRKEMMTAERVKAFAGLRPCIYVSLTIADNGKGMEPQTRDRVFEPFFSTHFPGRGLGIVAVYGMVKNHDGWISIESEVNQGMEVCNYLPAVGSLEESAMLSQLPMQKVRQNESF
jgi:PAS domain S-box-containing protein